MSTPKVSVIVPYYNHLDWLKEAVDSVLSQTYRDFEIILVDDGSTERIQSCEINLSDTRIVYVRQQNRGPGAARNAGIEAARGDYVAFLDADDVFEHAKLEKQLAFMKASGAVFCHTSYTTFDDKGNKSLVDTSWFHGDVSILCLAASPLATPTIMIRRDALESPRKRFAEHMRYGQDGYLWLQLAAQYEVHCLGEPLSRIRMRGSNAALRARAQIQYRAQILDFLEARPTIFGGTKRIPKGVTGLYKLCRRVHKLVERASKKRHLTAGHLELLSRFLYCPLWVGFRYYRRRLLAGMSSSGKGRPGPGGA